MTKANMIEEIQKKEAELWLALIEYDAENAPTTGNYDDEIEFDKYDAEHNRLLNAWYQLSALMETLGIERDFNLLDNKIAFDLSTELFTRRQAARGIHYDEHGNEIAC